MACLRDARRAPQVFAVASADKIVRGWLSFAEEERVEGSLPKTPSQRDLSNLSSSDCSERGFWAVEASTLLPKAKDDDDDDDDEEETDEAENEE